jgi:hypothetical protein
VPFEFKQGVRYRMPVVFGPAPGPRQKADGTPWTVEETGTMRAEWMTVTYRTDRSKLESRLPPGFSLRGEPLVAVSLAYFHQLYWLAGRGYGIVIVDFPATYRGKYERIEGAFCAVMWEGHPDAIMTGREELGFPKLFADIPELRRDGSRASGEASWLGHRFLDIAVCDLTEVPDAPATVPGFSGPPMYFKYMPRTGMRGTGGADAAYVTTPLPSPGGAGNESPIKFDGFKFRKWSARGEVAWNRATFEQLPTTFHIINGLADLDVLETVGAELVEFTGPGAGVSAGAVRIVEP